MAEPSAFLDSSVLHKISVSFAQEDYEAMIRTYQESGAKEWIEAAVTIDGKTYQNVGLRPKGNSSIVGLRPGAGGGFGGKSNILVERFKANHEWEQVYQDRLAQLRDELFGSGKAADILADWVAVLKTQAASLIDASTVDQEAANISKYLTVR